MEIEDKSKTEQIEEESQEGAMSFWDHLEVLRWALFRSACVLAVIMVGTFIAMPYIFDRFILAPTSNDFFTYRWLNAIGRGIVKLSPDFDVQIININVASQFMTHISTSISLAAIIAFPYFIWEIWRFIEPALFEDEVKHLRPAFLGGTVMFYIGCAIGYALVFPFTFRFLVEYNLSPNITNQINLQSYIDNFTMLILVMGIVFEMPLLAWLLSLFGILRKSFLREYKKHAVVVLLIAAAVITPSGDPFTLMLVFIPLYVLYELSILVVKDKPQKEEE
ncbi:MAG: twin-arginine translocase subunit TatC [Prevotella sp.]|nr:twin-arginine translocase subunit TatC [Prevotella sp.]MBP3712504.1 twin-arginine translocase subunit TatC [Bacteroidaceae bacterium]MBQ8454607.1 twin-arginine translocase subunit TatC [Bacteroidaceae bacterium]